jgi:hypothetical protein
MAQALNPKKTAKTVLEPLLLYKELRRSGNLAWWSKNVPRQERAAFARKEFGGLYFVIGSDDATATSQKIVRVNGLTGREYVYAKEIAKDTYTRGRIFYAAGRIYIIVFVGTSAEDLGSQEADRFLNSFRIR